MFEAITKAISEVQEEDASKFQRRKSKRASAKPMIHDTESRFGLLPLDIDDNFVEDKTHDKDENDKGSVDTIESDIEEDDDDLIEDRPKWKNDYSVIIHMIAFAVGGSNVWRFGFLCYNHGGIAFLVPYSILTLVCALPCVYLEILVGQYAQVGAIAAWKLVPIFKGVGMCMTLIAFMVLFNIQAIIAWSLFYIFQAMFYHPLPWISCDNGYGKKSNGQIDDTKEKWVPVELGQDEETNWHTENCTEFYVDTGSGGSLGVNERLPGSEYFRGRVQRMWKSGFADRTKDVNFTKDNGVILFGLDSQDGGILEYNMDTCVALIVTFIFAQLCIGRGVKSHGKMMAVITLSPFVWLVLLFYRATGLSGAWSGLKELFKPDMTKLWQTDTWWKCAEQVFFSTGAGIGVHLTFASHNSLNRKIVYDAIITVFVDFIASIVTASTIFMFLGHAKEAVNRDLKMFVRAGPELVFEVMADVLGVLAKANFYAVVFYLFIFLMSLTTVATTLICVKSSYLEVLPVSIKYKTGVRTMLILILYTISFIISSLCLTRGGLHAYSFLVTYLGLYSIVLCSFLFLIGISWFFGLREIVAATTAMNIRTPGMYFQISWKFISPIVLGTVFFGLIFDAGSHGLTFDGKKIPVSVGVHVVGFIIALGPLLAIIGGAAHAIWMAPGKNCKEKMLTSISPTKEHKDILATGTGKRAKLSHYFYIYAPTPGAKCNLCCSFNRRVAPEVVVNSEPHHDEIGVIYRNPSEGDVAEKNVSQSDEDISKLHQLLQVKKSAEEVQTTTEAKDEQGPGHSSKQTSRESINQAKASDLLHPSDAKASSTRRLSRERTRTSALASESDARKIEKQGKPGCNVQ